jgi:hypothetical protein
LPTTEAFIRNAADICVCSCATECVFVCIVVQTECVCVHSCADGMCFCA